MRFHSQVSFTREKFSFPVNYMNELSFLSLSQSCFTFPCLAFSTEPFSLAILLLKNDKRFKNQRWDAKDHMQFERNGTDVFPTGNLKFPLQ